MDYRKNGFHHYRIPLLNGENHFFYNNGLLMDYNPLLNENHFVPSGVIQGGGSAPRSGAPAAARPGAPASAAVGGAAAEPCAEPCGDLERAPWCSEVTVFFAGKLGICWGIYGEDMGNLWEDDGRWVFFFLKGQSWASISWELEWQVCMRIR